jgi:hypothetical protein
MTKRAPKGTPTDLNVSTLAKQFDTYAAPVAGDSAPAQVSPPSASGLRRCLKAGYVTVVTGRLVLTETGAAAIIAYVASYPTLLPMLGRLREQTAREQRALGIDPTTTHAGIAQA